MTGEEIRPLRGRKIKGVNHDDDTEEGIDPVLRRLREENIPREVEDDELKEERETQHTRNHVEDKGGERLKSEALRALRNGLFGKRTGFGNTLLQHP